MMLDEEGIKWIQSKVWQNEMFKHRDDFKIEMGTASWTAPVKRYAITHVVTCAEMY